MGERQIIVGQPGGGGAEARAEWSAGVEAALKFAAWAGLLLALIGLFDLALVWYPLGLGDTARQFATLATVPTAFPTVALGLVGGAIAAGAAVTGGAARGFLLLGNAVVGLAVLALTVWFIVVYREAAVGMEPMVLSGARKALARALVFGLAFGALHLGAAWWLRGRVPR